MTLSEERFYYDLNSHDVETLITKIQSGNPSFSLEKMIEKGLLPEKNNEIMSRMAQIESEALNRQNAEAERLRQLQNSDVRKQQIIDFCNQIADNQKGLEEIKISILNGIFTLEDMAQNLQNSRLTPDLFNKIGYYISGKKQVEFYLWKDLPPLLNDRTDIYFFGQPASGKSCILANMFSYIDKQGLIIENTHSLIGTQYKNTIQYEYDLGYLPERTMASSDGVNYITFELTDPINSGQQHPLNFIEMSGELFDQATMGGVSDNNLNAKNYLNNNNRKILFFVVDYDRHVQNSINPDGNTPQGAKMLTILSLLDQFGTFKNTDGIYILVSKADLFPAGVDAVKFAGDFLNENYMSFINNCKNIKKKYKGEFEIKAYPYSIGNLTLKSTYVYERDYTWAKKMIEEIVAKAFSNRSRGGLLSFFHKNK
jgi:hypothetical protein